MIKLGYLQGYNAYNVPSFASAQARDTYFDDITGLIEIDAYYPPFYTNTIKLDIAQVSQSTPLNFVILVHNNKYYYYFIDKQGYINENVYEITISMDSVLTHMFDFKITNGIINRKSIKRWDNNLINREYIRENLSEGIFDVDTFEYTKPNKYVIVATDSYYNNQGDDYTNASYNIDKTQYSLGYYIFVIPLPSNMENLYGPQAVVTIRKTGAQDISVGNPANLIKFFLEDPHVINMTYVESKYLDELLSTEWEYNSLNNVILNINYQNRSIVRISDFGGYVCAFAISNFNTDLSEIDYDVEVLNTNIGVKNTATNSLFSISYIPQLIDENYIQLKYGNITGFSSYPMHQAKTSSFKLYDITDVTTGNQGYYIKNTNEEDNRYNTYIFTASTNFDLITDAWKQYQAQNKGTLSTGLQLQVVNSLYSTVKGVMIKQAAPMTNITDTKRLYNNFDRNTQTYTEKTSYSASLAKGGTPISDGLMQGINIIGNYKTNKENLEYTPDTVKGRSSMLSMAFSKYLSPYIEVSICKDIITCARKLEEYGYKVNEDFISDNGSYINDIVTLRYYYNCIGINVIEYKLTSLISIEIINDIVARLSEGIRLFTMNNLTVSSNTMSSCLKYDNVELEEIVNE